MHTSNRRDRAIAAFAAIGMIAHVDDDTARCPRTGIVDTLPKTTATDAEFADLARSMQRRVTARLLFLSHARSSLADLAEQAASRCADDVRMNVRVGSDQGRLTIVMACGTAREIVVAETDRRLAFEEDGTIRPHVARALRREIATRVRTA